MSGLTGRYKCRTFYRSARLNLRIRICRCFSEVHYSEDTATRFPQNVRSHLPDWTVPHPRKPVRNISPLEKLGTKNGDLNRYCLERIRKNRKAGTVIWIKKTKPCCPSQYTDVWCNVRLEHVLHASHTFHRKCELLSYSKQMTSSAKILTSLKFNRSDLYQKFCSEKTLTARFSPVWLSYTVFHMTSWNSCDMQPKWYLLACTHLDASRYYTRHFLRRCISLDRRESVVTYYRDDSNRSLCALLISLSTFTCTMMLM